MNIKTKGGLALAYLMQILVNGLHNGAIYALLAWSYVLATSVTHRPNLMHGVYFAFSGQVLVLAAVQGYVVLWMAMWSAVLFGIAVSVILIAILAAVAARSVFPPLIYRQPNAMIVASLGLAIVTTEAARLGADTKELWLPPLTDVRISLAMLPGAPQTGLFPLVSAVVLLGMLGGCELVLRKTRAGRTIRSVSDDPAASEMLGINSGAVLSATIFASACVAGITGMIAVLHYGNMSFGSGMIFSLKVLFLASAGGFTTPLAAALAAFAYAECEALWDGYMPIAWRDAMFFSILAAILILRPQNGEKAV